MDTETRRRQVELLDIHKRYLAEIEVQIAMQGGLAPAHLYIQRDERKQAIAQLRGSSRSDLPDRVCYVNLWTYQQGERIDLAAPIAGTCERIDFSAFYSQTPQTVRFPSDEEWRTILTRLDQFGSAYSRDPTIAMMIHATPAVGLAFGKLFAGGPKGIWVNQGQNGSIDWWHSNAEQGVIDIPTPRRGRVGDGTDTVIEVCAIASHQQNTHQQVTAAIQRLSLSVRERVSIGFEDLLDGVHGPGHAVAIARIVGQAVRAARGSHEVHLFLTVPVGLAVFIGRELNACPPIRCYEHIRNDPTQPEAYYVPACFLR